jgi:HEAT repeat protein
LALVETGRWRVGAGLVWTLALWGCGGQQADQAVKSLFNRKSSGQQMFTALQEDDPDQRRKAIWAMAKSDAVAQAWAVKAFQTVARTDPDPQVRCAAIRALGRSGQPGGVETLLMILNWREHAGEVPYPPDDEVRWDATAVLSNLCSWGLVPEEQKAPAKATLLGLLRDDPNRHVRLEAARGLRYFDGDPEILEGLIAALNEQDFGVVYEAEASLVRLTGETFQYDAEAWRAWLGTSEAPFARAGQLPALYQSAPLRWWQRSWQAVRQVVILWQGERKEP